ncbi:MAG: DUF4428 domain-containing protein [Clostridia bacterium]|nr:DUF4428 domain-containing protein [Clostridia bacterium]
MALFDIFKKKDCEICGKEVGMFGYKKLEDGEICKECVKLLSPFFDDRRHSTVKQIIEQIDSRMKNSLELATFNHDVCLGDYYKVFIETKNNVPLRFVVSRLDDYKSENADIISFQNVSACTVDIDESKREEKYTNDQGQSVSYNPPRYTYRYDFVVKLDIANIPYISSIDIKLNSTTLELETVAQGGVIGGLFSKSVGFDPMLYPEYREYKAMCDEIAEYVSCGQKGVVCGGQYTGQSESEMIQSMILQIENAPDKETMEQVRAELIKMTFNHPDKDKIRDQGVEAMMRFEYKQAGIEPPADFHVGDQKQKVGESWTCFCGNTNTGKFCNECGAKKPASECSD